MRTPSAQMQARPTAAGEFNAGSSNRILISSSPSTFSSVMELVWSPGAPHPSSSVGPAAVAGVGEMGEEGRHKELERRDIIPQGVSLL